MQKFVKSLIKLAFVFSITAVSSPHTIVANAPQFQMSVQSVAYWIDQNTARPIPQQSGQNVPYNSTIRMDFSLSNGSGNIDAYLKVIPKEGMRFLSYYPGVLTINGVFASAEQYHNAIAGQGAHMALDGRPTQFSIHVQSIGTSKNRISTDLQIYSPSITLGPKTIIYDSAFSGMFAFPKTFPVSFYNETGKLLQQSNVVEGEYMSVPNITSRYGYTFRGFNTKMDGRGVWVKSGIVSAPLTAYAIFEINTYRVSFYVDNTLIDTVTVIHGSDASLLKPPKKKGFEFIRWEGNMKNIQEDGVVRGIYLSEEEANIERTLRIKKNKMKNGVNALEIVKTLVIKYQANNKVDSQDEQEHVKIVYEEEQQKISPFLIGSAVTLGIFVVYLIYKRKK